MFVFQIIGAPEVFARCSKSRLRFTGTECRGAGGAQREGRNTAFGFWVCQM